MEKDDRFKHVATDPKFRRIPKLEKKVKIDKRFHGMFKDERFKIKYTVDKRGRPVNHSTNNDLKRYYELSSSEEESDNDNEKESDSNDKEISPEKDSAKHKKAAKSKKEATKSKKDASNQKKETKPKKEGTKSKKEIVKPKKDSDVLGKESDSEKSAGEFEKGSGEFENDSDEFENESGSLVRPQKSDSEGDDDDLKKREKSDKKLSNGIKKKLKNLHVDYARGEGRLAESSSDDDTDADEDSDDSSIEHEWGELDKNAETTDEITKRLAVCNMDWDRIRAVDLMVLFNSFLPPGGLIESVTIYPSEFGKERMKEEELKGPTELVTMKNENYESEEEETEEGSRYHMEKLRQYQLNRLKYYYAVAVFDTPETANKIYTECDGLEYESSATKLDLRFIPDDTTFDDEPKEKCKNVPELTKYQPRFFTTTALQQAKVELTWDETRPERIEIAKKLQEGKIDDVTETDLQAYLASSSGEEDEEPEKSDSETEENPKNSLEKYRALLNDLEKSKDKKNKKDVEMEVTWELNTKDNAQKLVKKKMEESVEKTPFQELLDKRKEKRKQKKLERKSKREGDGEENEDSDNLVDSDDEIDMNDPYFAEEFQNSEFRKKKNKKHNDNKKETDSEDEQEKAQLELLMLDNDEGNTKHFSLKKLEEESKLTKKKKKKSKNDPEPIHFDDFSVDVKDPRFSAIYTSHHYNIDPTDPRYKKTKGMEALIEEKQKRIGTDKIEEVEEPPKKKSKSELNALVNSVKRKTKEFGIK